MGNKEYTPRRHREFSPFPTDPEKRFEQLLCAVNKVTKAQTLLLLDTHKHITAKELESAFKAVYPDKSAGLASAYCIDTFIPFGLVDGNRDSGYILTKEGRKFGLPVARLAASLFAQHNITTDSFLGKQNTNSEDVHAAPYTRAKILLALATGNLNMKTIVATVNSTIFSVDKAIKAFTNTGIITYRTNIDPGNVVYTYDESMARQTYMPFQKKMETGQMPQLTEAVAAVAKELGKHSMPISRQTIYEQLPLVIKANWQKEWLLNETGSILAHLAREHVLQPPEFSAHGIKSSAELTTIGGIVVAEFIRPVEELAMLAFPDHSIFEKILQEGNSNPYTYSISGAIALRKQQVDIFTFMKEMSGENATDSLAQEFPHGSFMFGVYVAYSVLDRYVRYAGKSYTLLLPKERKPITAFSRQEQQALLDEIDNEQYLNNTLTELFTNRVRRRGTGIAEATAVCLGMAAMAHLFLQAV